MADDMSTEITISIRTNGSQQAASAIRNVSDAIEQLNEKQQEHSAASAKIANAAAGQSTKLSQLASGAQLLSGAFTNAGTALKDINANASAFATTTGTVLSTVSTLAAGGLTPLGVVVTTINGLVSAGTTIWQAWSREQEESERATRANARSLRDLVAVQAQQREDGELEQRVRGGQGSVDEQAAFEADQRQAVDQAQREFDAANNAVAGSDLQGWRDRVVATERKLVAARTELIRAGRMREDAERNAALLAEQDRDRAEMARLIAMYTTTGDVHESPPRRGRRARVAPDTRNDFERIELSNASNAAEDLPSWMSEESAAFTRSLDEGAEREAAAIALDKESAERQREKQQRELDERTEHEWRITEMLKENEEKRLQEAEDAQERKVENYKKAAEYIETIGNATVAVYDFVSGAAADADESEEQKQKRELKRKAFAQAVEAVINTANAAAAFASFNYPSAIQYTVAAALNVAAAAKAGVDAGNVSAGAGAAGGGASGRSDELRRDATSSSSREPANITINMNGSVVATADRAELGRQLGQIIRMGDDRYGA